MKVELSVVATMYQSSGYLDAFFRRIVTSCEKVCTGFELILVNDGSPDDSLDKARLLARSDCRVKVIDLSRNFGHHKAIMTGLAHSCGEQVFLIDCDLEEPPELLESFKQTLDKRADIDMVYGVQQQRKGARFEKYSGKLFYKVVNALVDMPIPENFLTVRLMSRRFVNALCLYQERELNFSTLIALTGFNSQAEVVRKGNKGESSYTLIKKLQLLVNTITSASSKPLWIIFFLGLASTTLSFFAVLYALLQRLVFDVGIAGWTSLIISIWFLGGVLMLGIGTIGIYLSKVFIEVKQRPYVSIREIIHYDKVDNER